MQSFENDIARIRNKKNKNEDSAKSSFLFYLFITFVWLDKIIALILYNPSSCHTKSLVLLVVFFVCMSRFTSVRAVMTLLLIAIWSGFIRVDLCISCFISIPSTS